MQFLISIDGAALHNDQSIIYTICDFKQVMNDFVSYFTILTPVLKTRLFPSLDRGQKMFNFNHSINFGMV